MIDRIVAAIESGEMNFENAEEISEEEADRLFGRPDQLPAASAAKTSPK